MATKRQRKMGEEQQDQETRESLVRIVREMGEILQRPDPKIVREDDPIYLAELARLQEAKAKAGRRYWQPAAVRKRKLALAKCEARCEAAEEEYTRMLATIKQSRTEAQQLLAEWGTD